MELNGIVQNGVIVLTCGATLPEGTPVTVTCELQPTKRETETHRVVFPLVESDHPGSIPLTNERIAEILDEEDVEYARSVMGGPPYDASPLSDDERDALRAEALDDLGWDGMDAYQDDEK